MLLGGFKGNNINNVTRSFRPIQGKQFQQKVGKRENRTPKIEW